MRQSRGAGWRLGDPRRLSLDFGRADRIPRAENPFVWTDPPHPIETPFVKIPGLLSASCVENGQVVYLAVSRNAAPDGGRASDIKGDLIDSSGKLLPSWGLHLVDVNLAMGNLLTIVGDETRAYLAQNKKN